MNLGHTHTHRQTDAEIDRKREQLISGERETNRLTLRVRQTDRQRKQLISGERETNRLTLRVRQTDRQRKREQLSSGERRTDIEKDTERKTERETESS